MSNKEIDKVLLNNVSILKDLVGYQQGNVVSRTIVDKTTGTVTLFAFTKDQGLSEHTAPYDALVHVLEGEAEIIIDGKSYNLKEGEAIIMPANHSHGLTAKNEFKMILTMIKA
ncbi:cupin [Petrotoga sp. 9PW.55.5.1]|uniref:cupin domain-containing protein n=1 Tax=Petrotoga sp. 9PW.55.5.1 TaxID=1308979 RepID=UPI000DC53617|nr:cupin domain-containing protein [Petrotoga sp. 9PW.55.5.1]RAO99098.1 cupin [Petrotoga sp. 9PW.55.5.1]